MSGNNVHHCVAESLLGSRARRNTPRIDEDEHDSYHRAVGFQPPDMTLRYLLYSAMRSNGHAVDPAVVCDLQSILTPEDWRKLYVQETFLPHNDGTNRNNRAAIAAYHMRRFLLAEMTEVSSAVGRLTGISEAHNVKNTCVFFRSNDALEVMNRMIIEKTESGAYKWVEPMRRIVRSQVEKITAVPASVPLSQTQREKLIGLLSQQNERLAQWLSTVEPNIRNYTPELSELGGRGDLDMHEMD